MAIGNTFGATALSSYGGFWISFAIVLTPGGFNIEGALIKADNGSASMFENSFGLFLMVSSSESVLVLCRQPRLTVCRAGSSSPPSCCSAP
jgi:succinate-acetate transporter protein